MGQRKIFGPRLDQTQSASAQVQLHLYGRPRRKLALEGGAHGPISGSRCAQATVRCSSIAPVQPRGENMDRAAITVERRIADELIIDRDVRIFAQGRLV